MEQEMKDVAAQAAAELVKSGVSSIYDSVSNVVAVKRAQFFEAFGGYCDHIYGKCANVRTLYSKSAPMHIDHIYIKTRFQVFERFDMTREADDDELTYNFEKGQRIIVKGNGGSGKTVFLKHLWIQRFRKNNGKIPIFLELRRLNDVHSINLIAFCASELRASIVFRTGVFEKLCEEGRFEFIFDGFDEVTREKRRIIERQIIDLADTYKRCSFLVSGREDDRFSSWSDFEVYSIAPMNLDEVRDLIERIPFDKKVKKKFQNILDVDFYHRHESFLSSPLLATMMLMTFNENAIIPSKLTGFYDSAFQTLLTWHDATKDSFERSRALSIDEFRLVFSTFCLISYYEYDLEFDEASLRRYIIKSLKYHKFTHSPDEIKLDFCESVNLLQKDGLKYVFVHRSFQEYFAAECAMRVVSGRAASFLNAFAGRLRDNVFQMCYEIHPELVFDEYLRSRIPKFREFQSKFSSAVGANRSRAAGMVLSYVEYSFKGAEVELFDANLNREAISEQNLHLMDIADRTFFPIPHDPLDYLARRTPHMAVFRSILTAVNSSVRDALGSGGLKGSAITVRISFGGDEPSISIRNVSEKKIGIAEINAIKKLVDTKIEEALVEALQQSLDKVNKVEILLTRLEDDRNRKGESIDDILGI